MSGGLPEGLRERKKRAARAAVASTARRLFAERGFDAVTVAEIAAAADVSEKTVFNHFATKEDLAFAGREERMERLLADLRARPAGVSVLDVFRAATAALIDEVLAGEDDVVAMAGIIGGSRALQERLAGGWEDDAAALTAVVAETSNAAGADLEPALVARTLSWAHRAILGAALAGLRSGEDRTRLAARLREAADRAYDLLGDGLRDVGRRA